MAFSGWIFFGGYFLGADHFYGGLFALLTMVLLWVTFFRMALFLGDALFEGGIFQNGIFFL